MSLHRFFATGPLPEHAESDVALPLDARDIHHLVHVLRIRDAERIILVGADGREAEVALTHVGADEVRGDIEEPGARAPGPRVTLVQALTKRERMELVVQKATELGVAEIVPVVTARTIVKVDERKAGRRAERWQRIAEEASKQSQRSTVPPVREPIVFGELPALLERFDAVLVPWEDVAGSAPGIGEVLRGAGVGSGASVAVVVGPEGGFEDGEVALLVSRGAVAVSLGDTILRTETAGIVAVALTAYELGGLGNRGPGA